MSGAMQIVVLPAFLGLGAVAGLVHLTLLAAQVRALLGRPSGVVMILASFARGAATIAAFAAAAMQGTAPLVATLAGFQVVRIVLARRPEVLLP